MSWLEPPNDGRYGALKHWSFLDEARYFDDFESAPSDSRVVSLRRDDLNWQRVEQLAALEEVTAIEPSSEQLEMLLSLQGLKRLRLWHIRKSELTGLDNMLGLEELTLFHVSGPKTAERIGNLTNLRSLIIEAMPTLTDFSGLAGAAPLRCLCISNGMSSKNQKIEDLSFLSHLKELQHLMLAGIGLSKTPNFRPLLDLDAIETLAIVPSCLEIEDLAFLHAFVPKEKLFWPSTFTVAEDRSGVDAQGNTIYDVAPVAWSRDQVLALPEAKYAFWPGVKRHKDSQGTLTEIIAHVDRFEEKFYAEVARQHALFKLHP